MKVYIRVLSVVNLAHWELFESLVFVLNHKLNSKHGTRSHIPDFSAPLNPPTPTPPPLRPPLPGDASPRRGRGRACSRAHTSGAYVTALAPLLARWLKRRRKEHEKTCERSEDFSDMHVLFFFFSFFSFFFAALTRCVHNPHRCA